MKGNKFTTKFSSSFYIIIGAVLFTFLICEIYINQATKQFTDIPEVAMVGTTIPKTLPTKASVDNEVEIDNIKTNSLIKSPVKITGKIDSSWMYDGIFPVKLLDDRKQVIISTFARETEAGSWDKKGKVSFSVNLKYKTKVKSGYLVFETNNSANRLQTKKVFEMPVSFTQDAVNLKTYSSEKYQFTFKYPVSLNLKEQKIATDLLNLQFNENINFYVSEKKLTECDNYCPKINKTETIKAASVTFLKYSITPSKEVLERLPNALVYVLESSYQNKAYGLYVVVPDKSNINDLKISNSYVSQFTSSFKYLNVMSAVITVTPAQTLFCGGIAGKTCPAGYHCKLDGNYPDAGGTCVK
jgi:hypothetical protein